MREGETDEKYATGGETVQKIAGDGEIRYNDEVESKIVQTYVALIENLRKDMAEEVRELGQWMEVFGT